MNENYSTCGCVELKETYPTVANLTYETLEHLTKLNAQLSDICATLFGSAYGDSQKFESTCLTEAMVLLLDKAKVANEQAQRIRERLS